MKGMSQIISVFFLIVLTIGASFIVYNLVVKPRIQMFSDQCQLIIRYVTSYNSTHAICYVVKGEIKGLVYRNSTWINGRAFEGDLVIVPKTLVEVENG